MSDAVVITGANGGIGFGLVEAFSKNGYDVFACARKKNDDFEGRIEEVRKNTGREIIPVYFDLSNEKDIEMGVKQILSFKKPVSVLINNAGVPYGASFLMTPIEDMKSVYDVNVFAQVKMMQLISRRMMRQKKGCIINICSVGGIETSPGYLAYGSSKAAMIWITKEASKELGQYGIRVNGIAPGLIDTKMGHYKSEDELEKVLNRMTIKRMGKVEEVTNAALYIASEEASFMTGQVLVIDGGRV